MFVSPFSLRRTLMAGFCAAGLVMGACSGGDKADIPEISVDAASLELSKADQTALSRYFEVAPRSGSEATTLALLAALGLDDDTAIQASRVINGSSVIYTDWAAEHEGIVYKADRVSLMGLHDVDGRPTFDKMIVSDLFAEDFEDGDQGSVKTVEATLGEMTVVSPSPDLAESLVRLLRGEQGADITDNGTLSYLSDNQSFAALHLQDLTVSAYEEGEEGTLSIAQIVVGNDSSAERLDLIVETVDFDWLDGFPSGLFDLEMDGLTLLGLDTSVNAKDVVPSPNMGIVGTYAQILSPSGKMPYRQINLGKLDLKSSVFDLTTEGFEADSKTSGSKTTMQSVLSPMVITFKDAAGTPVAPYMDVLRENGLAEITVKGSQTMTLDRKDDRMVVTDARMEIDESLRTRCDYAVQGVVASSAYMEAQGLTTPTLNIDGDTAQNADFDRYLAEMEAFQHAQAEANKRIKIESLNCDIQDIAGNSLLDRGYKVAAEVTGKPVAVLKGAAKTMIALGSLTARTEFERDLMDTVGSGLIDFIETPGQTMTITVAPETPVSITTLTGQDGSEPTIKPLGLSVEVR